MICSGCGMDIPFAGQVCPNCQRDKSADQQWLLKAQLILFIFIIPGALIGALINGLLGALIGVAVSFVAFIIYMMATKAPPPLAGPPKVHVSNMQSSENLDNTSIEQKLTSLAELKEKGLITEEEFLSAKKKIISNI